VQPNSQAERQGFQGSSHSTNGYASSASSRYSGIGHLEADLPTVPKKDFKSTET
jgi:hypothetical protein